MQSARPPNILLLLSDQHQSAFLGTNPTLPVRTPNIDALGRSGIRFTNAFCPSPLCAPSRACLASGRDYERCGVPDNNYDYPINQPTYYAALREVGYHVAAVGKLDLHKATLDWDLDGTRLLEEWGFSEGIDNEGKRDAIRSGAAAPTGPYMAWLHERGLAEEHVEDFRNRHSYLDTHPTPLPEEAYCDNWIAANGLRLLRAFQPERPWHLVVNFTGPHAPMDVTEEMQRRWKDVDFPQPHKNDQWDPETHHQIRRNYAAMVENIDRHVGSFIEALQYRGELENTIVVYSSDHGEMLGDHGLWGKSSWRQHSVCVPMVVAGPGVVRGVVSDALVSLHDLAATFVGYGRAASLPGTDSRSLRQVFSGEQKTHRDVVRSALKHWRLIYDGRYKLVLDDTATPLLFDLQSDPLEDANLANHLPAELARLRAELIAAHEKRT